MASEQFSNFARSTLATAIDSDDTTIVLTDGSKFPTRDFYIAIGSEAIWVTTRSANTLNNCARNQKGSQPASYGAGTTVVHGPLAHHIDELYQTSQPNISAKLYRAGSASTLTHGGSFVVPFDGVSWDTDNMFAAATPGRLTARRAGKYLCEATVCFSAHATGRRSVSFLVNGGSSIFGTSTLAAVVNGVETTVTTSAVVTLAAGDYVEVQPFQDSGTTLTLLNSGQNHPSFSMSLISGGAQPNVPSASLARSSAYALTTSGTQYAIPYTSAVWDTDGMWDSANPSRLTCKTAGKYVVTFRVGFPGNATGVRRLDIAVNGIGGIVASEIRQAFSADSNRLIVTTTVDLKVGDYVEGFAMQTSGASMTLENTATGAYPSLSMTMQTGGLARSTNPPQAVSARMTKTSSQALTATTWALASWETTQWDTGGLADLTGERFTIRQDGKYLVNARAIFSSTATNRRGIIAVWKNSTVPGTNGVELARTDHIQVPNGADTANYAVTAVVDLLAGDTVQIGLWAGASATAGSANTYETTFEITLLSGNPDPVTPSARLTKATAQSVGASAWTDIVFTSARFDTDRMFDSVNGRLVCRSAGRYDISAHISWVSNASGERIEAIAVNGTRVAIQGPGSASSANGRNSSVSTIVDLKVGDYVTAQAFSTAATSLSSTGTQYEQELSATMLPSQGTPARSVDYGPAVSTKARRTTNFTVTNNSWSSIPFETAEWDTSGMWSSTTPTRLTVRRDGKYLVQGLFCVLNPTGTNTRYVRFTKNGLPYLISGEDLSTAGGFTSAAGAIARLNHSVMLDLKAGDYLEFQYYVEDGEAVLSAQEYGTWFSASLMSGASYPVGPAARVHRGTSNTPILNGVDTFIPFTLIDFDTDRLFDLSSPTRLTCKSAGKYLINGDLYFEANSTGIRQVSIRLNGTTYLGSNSTNAIPSGSGGTEVSTSVVIDMKVGDYVELHCYQNSGVTLQAAGTNLRAPVLSAAMLAPGVRPGNETPAVNVVAVARRTTSQTLTANAATTMSWESVTMDTDTIWSSAVPTRLTAKTAGKYLVTASIRLNSNATGTQRAGYIVKNGTTPPIYGTSIWVPGGYTPAVASTAIIDMAVGDYVEYVIYNDATGNLTIDTTTLPSMSMALLSGTTNPVAPAVKAHREGAQTLTLANTWYPISFTVEAFDTDGMWDLSNPTRLTCKTAGKYHISGSLYISGATGTRALGIRRNGTQYETIAGPHTSNDGNYNVSTVLDLKVGDYVELIAQSTVAGVNAGFTNVLAVNSYACEFSAALAAPGIRGSDAPANNVGASIRSTGAQSITNNTTTKVNFDTVNFDTDGMADLTNERLTIRTPGKYLVTARVRTDNNGSGTERAIWIRKNGVATTDYGLSSTFPTGATGVPPSVAIMDLAAGDYLEAFVYFNATSAMNIGNISAAPSTLEAILVSGVANPVAPGARVYLAGAGQSIPGTGTWTPISFNTEVKDTDSIFDLAAPTRLTARTAGWYTITGSFVWPGTAGGNYRLGGIRKNGGGLLAQATSPFGTGTYPRVSLAAVEFMNVGDYVELNAYQDSGSALATYGDGESAPIFGMVMAAPFGEITSQVASMPQGALGYVKSTTNSAAISAETVLFSKSVTVNAGRLVKITHHEPFPGHSTAGDAFEWRCYRGSTLIGTMRHTVVAGDPGTSDTWSTLDTPAAGTYTYEVRAARTAGSGTETENRSATSPGYMVIEDIGSA